MVSVTLLQEISLTNLTGLSLRRIPQKKKKEELQKITKVGRGGQPLSIDRVSLKPRYYKKKLTQEEVNKLDKRVAEELNKLDKRVAEEFPWTVNSPEVEAKRVRFAKRISTPEKRGIWQKLNKANSVPEIKRRDVELTALAQKLEKGKIEFEEYRSEYDKKFPVKTFNKVPPLSSGIQIAGAIDQGQYDKGKLIGEDSDLTGGMEALVRFDVNSMSKYNVGVVTAVSPQAKGSHYGKAAHLVSKKDGTPVKMITKNKKNVLGIAAGESKFPMAYFKGEWKGSTAPQIKKLAQKLINKPNWIQVGMEPKRQSSFYARETKVIDGKSIEAGTPIDTAEEVLQVGMFALVKNPTTKAVPEFTSRAGTDVRFAKNIKKEINKVEIRFAKKLDEGKIVHGQIIRDPLVLDMAKITGISNKQLKKIISGNGPFIFMWDRMRGDGFYETPSGVRIPLQGGHANSYITYNMDAGIVGSSTATTGVIEQVKESVRESNGYGIVGLMTGGAHGSNPTFHAIYTQVIRDLLGTKGRKREALVDAFNNILNEKAKEGLNPRTADEKKSKGQTI